MSTSGSSRNLGFNGRAAARDLGLLDDRWSATFAWRAARGTALPKNLEKRLTVEWLEGILLAEQDGQSGLADWLGAVEGRDPELARVFRDALEETRVDPGGEPDGPAPPTDKELGLTDLSTVTPVEVEWLWNGRIPLGKITLLAGEGGVGKTFLALGIAAGVSRATPWADRPEDPIPPGDVIVLSAEDDLNDTIVPRLIRQGADLGRISALGTAKLANGLSSPFTLADVDRLDQVIDRRPGTRLIVVDPVTAFLGRGVDDHKNAELRGLLGPLAEFAARRRVAILCITHFNKTANPRAASRVIGSVAYSNAARATWCVVMDPEQDGRRLMLPVKNNLSPDKTGMAYRLVDGILEWERDPVSASVDEVLASDPPAKLARKEVAINVIKEVLAAGPLPSDEALALMATRGVARRQAFQHKAEAGVIVSKQGYQGQWTWRLVAQDSERRSAADTL